MAIEVVGIMIALTVFMIVFLVVFGLLSAVPLEHFVGLPNPRHGTNPTVSFCAWSAILGFGQLIVLFVFDQVRAYALGVGRRARGEPS